MEDFFSLLNGALEDLWLGVVGYKSQQFGCTVLIGSTDSFVAWLSFWAVHWACFMSLIWHMGHFQDPPEADLEVAEAPMLNGVAHFPELIGVI